MKIVQLTPTYFSDASFVSGAERYVVELAAAMTACTDTTLVSFAASRQSYRQGALKIELYPVKYLIRGLKLNPFSLRYLSAVLRADVVHIHQINTLVSDLACLVASSCGKRVFVTDHGGGGDLVLNQRLPVFPRYRRAIAQSQFGQGMLPAELRQKSVLIKGGIDIDRFCPLPEPVPTKTLLYVGRILPHKGINYLVEAFRLLNRPDYTLRIIGRPYHERFYTELKQLAQGLPVEFVPDADDQRLLHEYRSAIATLLPSVHTNCYGEYTPVPELMGFTLLESQACGTPVVCTDAGAMPEFVQPGLTGFVVAQNSPEAIAQALRPLLDLNPGERLLWQDRCRRWIAALSWKTVVHQHLQLYAEA